MKPTLAIIVPCYNEEEVLLQSNEVLCALLKQYKEEYLISEESFLFYVDDGSTDKTWTVIEEFHKENRLVRGMKLSKNAGHQKALLAGLTHTKDRVDCTISIDADLQDDPSCIREMLLKFHEGCSIVYGVRKDRDSDVFFKRKTSELFYWLMKKIFKVELVAQHADFRLVGSTVLDCICQFQENHLFLRGLFPTIGFKSGKVYYKRLERSKGESKYPLGKMTALALDGITSFTILPLRMLTWIGFTLFLGSMIFILWVFLLVYWEKTVPGWASTVLPIYFLGGIQLLGLGLIGEYIGKVFLETKRRPRYFIEKEITDS